MGERRKPEAVDPAGFCGLREIVVIVKNTL
jgi:hypothetical protein